MKKYSVFVSSHYSSLKKERKELIRCLQNAGFFPIAMEHFTLEADQGFESLKNLIDQSDAFVLLLGDEYGSCDENGISWTQREYEYACECGKKPFAISTRKYKKLKSRHKLFLSEDDIKQLKFGSNVTMIQEITKNRSIEAIVNQISTKIIERQNELEGWSRLSTTERQEIELWKHNNNVFNLSGDWYHIHYREKDIPPSNRKEEISNNKIARLVKNIEFRVRRYFVKPYIRVGKVRINQKFDSENFTQLQLEATNYDVLSYNETKVSLRKNETRKTVWSGNYTLESSNGNIFGAYKAVRHFKEKYDSEWKVAEGRYLGIHDLYIVDTDGDKDMTDSTTEIHGKFDDVNSPKKGSALFFRNKSERDKFVINNYKDVLEEDNDE